MTVIGLFIAGEGIPLIEILFWLTVRPYRAKPPPPEASNLMFSSLLSGPAMLGKAKLPPDSFLASKLGVIVEELILPSILAALRGVALAELIGATLAILGLN